MYKSPNLIASDDPPFSAADIVDVAKLSPLFNSYTNMTGFAAALVDLDGEVLIAANWKESCTEFHRKNEVTARRCLESDTALANDLRSGGQYNVYRCKNGLVDVATPVVVEGYHIANVFIGQFFFDPPDLDYYREQARAVGFDEEDYLWAIADVPIFSEEDIREKMEFIVQLAQMIGEFGVQNLKIRQANDELSKAKQLAEEASRAKSIFLSRMSHELRTPLNAVMGFADVLKIEIPEADTDKHEMLNHISNAGLQLLTLVTDILDVVCLDSQAMNIPLSDISLSAAVNDSIAMLRPMAADQHVAIHVGDLDHCVLSNRQRLQQVLVNLLSNAIKYNKPGGSVTVSARPVGGNHIEIAVTDTGVGIAAEELAKLFKPFSRLSYAETSAIPGAGIGLSLCKYLVEEMHGTIAIPASEPDGGTSVTVTLPVGDAEKVQNDVEVGSDNEWLKQLQQGLRNVTGSILYIEDSIANLKLLELIAERFPALVFEGCGNAEEGVRRARQMQPSLIILDINLPGIDGFEALKRLRAEPGLEKTRIVALSADALPNQIERAMAAGFDDYFTKPVHFPNIVALLKSIQPAA